MLRLTIAKASFVVLYLPEPQGAVVVGRPATALGRIPILASPERLKLHHSPGQVSFALRDGRVVTICLPTNKPGMLFDAPRDVQIVREQLLTPAQRRTLGV